MGKNLTPGMDDAQAQKDRAGYSTSVENVTGGTKADIGDGSGLEVGNPYDTGLGEDRTDRVTYTETDKQKGS